MPPVFELRQTSIHFSPLLPKSCGGSHRTGQVREELKESWYIVI